MQPVLVLPGWYIERVRRGDVLVLNGKKDIQFISNQWTHRTLSRDLIQRISEVLEGVCRDVEPMAYKSSRGKEAPATRPRKVLARVMPLRRINKASGH